MMCPHNNNKIEEVIMNELECLPMEESMDEPMDEQSDESLRKAHRKIIRLQQKLRVARKKLEDEKHKRRSVERFRDTLESHIKMIINILFYDNKTNLDEELKRKLQERLHFLHHQYTIEMKTNFLFNKDKQNEGQLATIMEIDSTGSILSDMNCLSKSEDELDASIKAQNQIQYKQQIDECAALSASMQQLSIVDGVKELTGLTNVKIKQKYEERITASRNNVLSNRKSISIAPLLRSEVRRKHTLKSKIVKPEQCSYCNARLKFGKTAWRCIACPDVFHSECKKKLVSHPGRSNKKHQCTQSRRKRL